MAAVFARRVRSYLPYSAAAATLVSWSSFQTSDQSRFRRPEVGFAKAAFSQRQACRMEEGESSLSVLCYNVLCATYGMKWKEREAFGPDGENNWSTRWPVMRDIVLRAQCDIICMQEVEHTDGRGMTAELAAEYDTHYFKHAKRPPDGVLIGVRRHALKEPMVPREFQWQGAVAFGSVDFVHEPTGCRVRVVTGHLRGGNADQLRDLAAFADDSNEADVTIVTGDFNEDFGVNIGDYQCPLPDGPLGSWVTLQREPDLPQVSRPPHKQGEDQKSGKGKIDFIFVRATTSRCGIELFRGPASKAAVLESHKPCGATGQWPSDHGCEALSFKMLPPPF